MYGMALPRVGIVVFTLSRTTHSMRTCLLSFDMGFVMHQDRPESTFHPSSYPCFEEKLCEMVRSGAGMLLPTNPGENSGLCEFSEELWKNSIGFRKINQLTSTLHAFKHILSVRSPTLVPAKDEHGDIRTRRDRYGFLGAPGPHDAVSQLPLRRHSDCLKSGRSGRWRVRPVFTNVGFGGGP